MKVTVQNGSRHGLSRREIEAMISAFPESWLRAVKQIVLYEGAELTTAFYPKAQTLGLFWPMPPAAATKLDGIRELLVALATIADKGTLPEKITRAQREQQLAQLEKVLALCESELN
jgi:hypothetical protein